MKRWINLFFLIFLFNGSLFCQQAIDRHWNHLLGQTQFAHAQAGIQIVDVETGEEVYGRNSEQLFIPASVMKLVTSAVALEMLGAEYRFLTRLGYSGKIVRGVLSGDLLIIGGGDPALGSEYFNDPYFVPHFLETWAKQIKALGINRVEGNLVLDGTWYDQEKIPPTWVWEDMGNYYGAGTSALTVYDNLFRIHFRSPAKPGMPTEIVSVQPEVEGLSFVNEVVSSDQNRDLAWVFGSPFDGARVIRGSIPKNRRLFTIKASNPYPEKILAEDFLQFLAREGIFISGEIVCQPVHQEVFKQVCLTESPPLSELIQVVNHKSVNLFAEHLVKQVAAEKKGIGSRQEGLTLITEFWKSKGLDVQRLFMEDGSGLSHFNAVSPAFLCSLLGYMEHSSVYTSFYESMPLAGSETLHVFRPANFPGKVIRAKSGSMTRVRSYAGYIQSGKGKKYTFAVMVNHFSGAPDELTATLEKIFSDLD
ncbi:MAG: D-alanyl-D-alanine carboxypeptidase/D-alanyl-D-alanine-endopeptidase [Mariniphaga sp.]|nr:D-alanyl-D-alanine carboxypeptidase/D-alanyl-D-alanine-endopeptidase [Mariniphaga sp.]